MTIQAGKSAHPILIAAGIAVILFSATGIAALMGWIPTSIGESAHPVADSREPLQSGDAMAQANRAAAQPHSVPAYQASNAPAHPVCAECGVIESVRAVARQGQATGLGLVGGAVVGGLVGNQIGGGHGRDAMTVVGAVGGAVAGNQIEKNARTTHSYEIVVRLNNGSRRVFHEANAPVWRPGDRVRIVDGVIRSNG